MHAYRVSRGNGDVVRGALAIPSGLHHAPHISRRLPILFPVVDLLLGAGDAAASSFTAVGPTTLPVFELHSGFWSNLHPIACTKKPGGTTPSRLGLKSGEDRQTRSCKSRRTRKSFLSISEQRAWTTISLLCCELCQQRPAIQLPNSAVEKATGRFCTCDNFWRQEKIRRRGLPAN